MALRWSFIIRKMEVHEVESCVRGYPDIWNPDVGDILNCERKSGNRIDSYAVAIKRGASVIGHVPRKLAAACSLFLSLGRTINCGGGATFSAAYFPILALCCGV